MTQNKLFLVGKFNVKGFLHAGGSIMFGFDFLSIMKSSCRRLWAARLLVASFGFSVFAFFTFVLPACALGLDVGVAKVGLDKNGLSVEAGKGIISAKVSSDGLMVDIGKEVNSAAVGLGEAAVVANFSEASGGNFSAVEAGHNAESKPTLLSSLSDGKDGIKSVDGMINKSIDKNRTSKGATISLPLVKGNVLAESGGLVKGSVSKASNNGLRLGGIVADPVSRVISPVAGITGEILEPVDEVIERVVTVAAEVPVVGPPVGEIVNITTGVVDAGLELVDHVTGDVLVPLAGQVLDAPSTLLTPVLETVDGLLETDLTQTVRSLLTFVSDKGKGIIGTVDGLLPVVNEILEPVERDTGSNYARDGPGERFYNPTFLPGEETGNNCISSSRVNIVPESGFPRQLIFNKGQTTPLSNRCFPDRNQTGVDSERVNSVNAGSGTGAGGNHDAVNNAVFKLDRLPLNGVITEFLNPDRLPPFISLFSPPG